MQRALFAIALFFPFSVFAADAPPAKSFPKPWSSSFGAGYKIIKSPTRNLSVDGGAGAEIENTTGVGRSSSGALKSGEDYDWTLSPTSKITQKLSGIWKTKDFADALYHFDAGITTTVATRVELKIAYVYDYKTRPSLGAKKGDSALFAALLVKF